MPKPRRESSRITTEVAALTQSPKSQALPVLGMTVHYVNFGEGAAIVIGIHRDANGLVQTNMAVDLVLFTPGKVHNGICLPVFISGVPYSKYPEPMLPGEGMVEHTWHWLGQH